MSLTLSLAYLPREKKDSNGKKEIQKSEIFLPVVILLLLIRQNAQNPWKLQKAWIE